jgi:hypothetical protein
MDLKEHNESLFKTDSIISNPSKSLCDHCKCLFLQPNTLQLLTSKNGLQNCRKRSEMMRAALDGCMLCQELLCMPQRGPYTDWNPRPIVRWKKIADSRESRRVSNWPLVKLMADWTDPTLRYEWKGDLGTQHLLEVIRRRQFCTTRKMHMEVSVASGVLHCLHIFPFCWANRIR